MDEKLRFGRRLKALRKQRGLTQEDLADLIDRSVDAVSHIERGISLPSYETLGRLAEVLDVALTDLSDWYKVDPSQGDPERARLESTLIQVAKSLDTLGLRIAVEQIQALSRHLGA